MDVGDTFIMQNYLVLLCKITVCVVSEQGTEGSAGSSITQSSITLIILIRSFPSPRRCGAPVDSPSRAGLSRCQVHLCGAGGGSHPPDLKGATAFPPWTQK